ncbi:protein FRA10AC1 homolog [Arctopsyche grandis]|uniref:protein FRA10AC1 homolog n=1 Tax=Arctopsyche grandis TaxID=121162 RepID=UPI00406D716E
MSRLKGLNAYDLHKLLINEYVLTEKGSTKILSRDTSRDKRDIDVIRENHRFLWDDESADTWEKQLAKKYYDKLFKEYCICDLSRYKENKVALRWRIEHEVIAGKGQFACGNKVCNDKESLRSWEVNFAYVENNEKKNALVKLRLCVECSAKLNYHKKKKEIKRLKKSKNMPNVAGSKSDDDDLRTEVMSSTESVEASTSEVSRHKNVPVEEPWKKGHEPEEKTREDEFQSYLEDLLL